MDDPVVHMKPHPGPPGTYRYSGSWLRISRGGAALTTVFLLSTVLGSLQAGPGDPAIPSSAQAGDDLFGDRPIPTFHLRLTADAMERLRRNRREDVRAELEEQGMVLGDVGVHLKGTAGSLRDLDDKPSWTLDFAKYRGAQRFHGLRKIHLNNSVEDPSYFNERWGQRCFESAGLPAPRVGHAILFLNGRRLGLHVLKEGFTQEFLERSFANPQGNLYEPGAGHDVDETLDLKLGAEPAGREALRRLVLVVQEPSLEKRWACLQGVLDVDRFTTFLAMEAMLGHRDGYALARNNFRIYLDPGSDRVTFLPHGMDQLLGRPDATMRPAMQGGVARAFMEIPEARKCFRERWSSLLDSTFDLAAAQDLMNVLTRRTRPLLDAGEFRDLKRALDEVKRRCMERRAFLEQQRQLPEPTPPVFLNGSVSLRDWRAVGVPSGGTMDRTPAPDGRPALRIRAGPRTSASWRTTVLLRPGRYRFAGDVSTHGVEPLSFGRNRGAGLRVVPDDDSTLHTRVGDQAWAREEQRFVVTREQEVELLCELRARKGVAWFALNSLQLELLP